MVKKEKERDNGTAQAARSGEKGTRRLKGIINSVLRRRINDCERELRPSVLQYLDPSPDVPWQDMFQPAPRQRLLAPAADVAVTDPSYAGVSTESSTFCFHSELPACYRTMSDPSGSWPGSYSYHGWLHGPGTAQHHVLGRSASLGADPSPDTHVFWPATAGCEQSSRSGGCGPLEGHSAMGSEASGPGMATTLQMDDDVSCGVQIGELQGDALTKHSRTPHVDDLALHTVGTERPAPEQLPERRGYVESVDYRWLDHYAREACAPVRGD